MPDGSEVFFRFWDGRHLLPILAHLGEKRTKYCRCSAVT